MLPRGRPPQCPRLCEGDSRRERAIPQHLRPRRSAGARGLRPIKELNRWRESEITHGRVAMLASLGFIVQEQLQDYALFYNFDGQIKGPAIYHVLPAGGGARRRVLGAAAVRHRGFSGAGALVWRGDFRALVQEIWPLNSETSCCCCCCFSCTCDCK